MDEGFRRTDRIRQATARQVLRWSAEALALGVLAGAGLRLLVSPDDLALIGSWLVP
jgi:hypothetical protein